MVVSAVRLSAVALKLYNMNNEIKLGDFIKGTYNTIQVYGVIVNIKKDLVVIKKHSAYGCDFKTMSFSYYIPTKYRLNVRRKNIKEVLENADIRLTDEA